VICLKQGLLLLLLILLLLLLLCCGLQFPQQLEQLAVHVLVYVMLPPVVQSAARYHQLLLNLYWALLLLLVIEAAQQSIHHALLLHLCLLLLMLALHLAQLLTPQQLPLKVPARLHCIQGEQQSRLYKCCCFLQAHLRHLNHMQLPRWCI
jgi:chromate transport protein ChrA